MPQSNDLSRCLIPFSQDETLVAVVEMSKTSWLVAGMIPGVARHPLKKLVPDEKVLFELLERWRDEAVKAGKIITRITVAYEAGRDGFWLARWLRARGFEVYVVHSSSVAVTREHRRAIKRPNRERENLVGECTRIVGRLKAGLARLGIRSFNPKLRNAAERLESLRTPEDVPVPANTLCELRRDMARLRFVKDQIKQIERARVRQLEQAPEQGPQQMVRLLARVLGIGIETADMLVHEILSRNLRDRRAVARYAGLTGSPDESGQKRREKGLSRAGNARVRRGMIQLAWRFLMFQKTSALAQWYRVRTKDAGGAVRKTLIVALARKLLISLWRFVTTGEVPVGVTLRVA